MKKNRNESIDKLIALVKIVKWVLYTEVVSLVNLNICETDEIRRTNENTVLVWRRL